MRELFALVLRLCRRPGRDRGAGLAGASRAPTREPDLAEVVDALTAATRADAGLHARALARRLDATGRWALLKLVTGGLRVGVSARLAKQALAEWAQRAARRDRGGLARAGAALRDLFAWLEGTRAAARDGEAGRFRR